jgi:DNA-binding Xre family transcriptional regulator
MNKAFEQSRTEIIRDNLVAAMKTLGVKQTTVAHAIGKSGGYVSQRLKKGATDSFRSEEQETICQHLGIPFDDLLRTGSRMEQARISRRPMTQNEVRIMQVANPGMLFRKRDWHPKRWVTPLSVYSNTDVDEWLCSFDDPDAGFITWKELYVEETATREAHIERF